MMKYFVVGCQAGERRLPARDAVGEVALGAVPKVGLPSWSARGGLLRQVHLHQRGHGGADVEADVGAAVAGAQLRPVMHWWLQPPWPSPPEIWSVAPPRRRRRAARRRGRRRRCCARRRPRVTCTLNSMAPGSHCSSSMVSPMGTASPGSSVPPAVARATLGLVAADQATSSVPQLRTWICAVHLAARERERVGADQQVAVGRIVVGARVGGGAVVAEVGRRPGRPGRRRRRPGRRRSRPAARRRRGRPRPRRASGPSLSESPAVGAGLVSAASGAASVRRAATRGWRPAGRAAAGAGARR